MLSPFFLISVTISYYSTSILLYLSSTHTLSFIIAPFFFSQPFNLLTPLSLTSHATSSLTHPYSFLTIHSCLFILSYPFLPIHSCLFVLACPFLPIHYWLSIHAYPFLTIHSCLFILAYPFLPIHS